MSDQLRDILLRRAAEDPPPPPLHPSIGVTAPADDPAEMVVETVGEDGGDAAMGRYLAIRYVADEDDDEESVRCITVHRVVRRNGVLYVHAFCHLRRAARCFRGERIRELIDPVTGEVTEGAHVEARLEAIGAPRDAPEATPQALTACRDGMLILMFLARCDGLDPRETDVLLEYLDHSCAAPGIDETAARAELARLAPDPIAYDNAVRRMARLDPEGLKRVARFARRLVDADGEVTALEATHGIEIDDALAAKRRGRKPPHPAADLKYRPREGAEEPYAGNRTFFVDLDELVAAMDKS